MDTQPHGGGTANGGSPQQFCLRWHNHQVKISLGERSIWFYIAFSPEFTDKFTQFVATAVGSVAPDRRNVDSRRSQHQSPPGSAKRVQYFLFGTVPNARWSPVSGDCPAGGVLSRRGRSAHVHVLGRGECLRGADINPTLAGRDAGHQGTGRL